MHSHPHARTEKQFSPVLYCKSLNSFDARSERAEKHGSVLLTGATNGSILEMCVTKSIVETRTSMGEKSAF